MSPNVIKLGYLVEVQCSIGIVPTGKDQHTMLLTLRSICILDRSVLTVSQMLPSWSNTTTEGQDYNRSTIEALRYHPSLGGGNMKRKVGYSDDDGDGVEANMKKMRLMPRCGSDGMESS